MDQAIRDAAKKIWDYHLMHQPLKKADCILVFGSFDTRVAEWAAELFLKGYAPLIVFSGATGFGTEHWAESEAQIFADIAMKMGVPEEKILVENKATNTGENIQFSRALLQEHHLDPQTVILVQKPFMERRTWAAFKKQWPEKECIVTSPPIPFEQYPNTDMSEQKVIEAIVRDLQRIKIYAEKGFQIQQEIPQDVWDAFEFLVAKGYTKGVIV